jgi:hypothetical protein
MIETGLHYHRGYKYLGQYRDELEDGEWIITKNDVLFSTCEFKQGFQDGEMKMFNEDGEIICLVVFDKGEMCETLADLINVKEMMRVLDLKPTSEAVSMRDNSNVLWKVGDVDDVMESKGEGFLLSYKDLEKLSKE